MNIETQRTSFTSIYRKDKYENRKIMSELHVKEKKKHYCSYILYQFKRKKALLFALSFIKCFESDFL